MININKRMPEDSGKGPTPLPQKKGFFEVPGNLAPRFFRLNSV